MNDWDDDEDQLPAVSGPHPSMYDLEGPTRKPKPVYDPNLLQSITRTIEVGIPMLGHHTSGAPELRGRLLDLTNLAIDLCIGEVKRRRRHNEKAKKRRGQ